MVGRVVVVLEEVPADSSGLGNLVAATPPADTSPGGCAVVVVGLGAGIGGCVLGHWMLLSLALVAEQVEVTKHLLVATFAPTSVKYCRERFIPLTMREACWCRLAERKRSSARTLGSAWLARIVEIQGRISRATSAIENGHPCGIEHRCWCG